MSNKPFFTTLLILLQTICFSQKKFEAYNFDAKALTQNLETYKIIILRKDTSFTPHLDIQRHQLEKAFTFLRDKKEVKDNPDFFIRIIIQDKNIKVNYQLFSSDSSYDYYKIRRLYDLSFTLEFDVEKRGKINMPLCGYKHYDEPEKYMYAIERLNTFDRNSQYYRIDAREVIAEGIDGRVSALESFLEKREEFNTEFNLVFRKFRKDKCKEQQKER